MAGKRGMPHQCIVEARHHHVYVNRVFSAQHTNATDQLIKL